MPGFLTSGVPNISLFTGAEQLPVDTQNSAGQNPESGSVTLTQLGVMLNFLTQNLAAGKTMVAGTRYYGSINIGASTLLTGIAVLVGGTGGTDLWDFELFNSAGVLVATTLTTGTTAGTAATWQKIAFTAQYQAAAGTYFISIQSNGTTAKFAAYNAPTAPSGMVNGSAAGTLGTGASITPPTTYTANLSPISTVY